MPKITFAVTTHDHHRIIEAAIATGQPTSALARDALLSLLADNEQRTRRQALVSSVRRWINSVHAAMFSASTETVDEYREANTELMSHAAAVGALPIDEMQRAGGRPSEYKVLPGQGSLLANEGGER